MNISEMLSNLSKYISDAMARIFGPNDDEYPEVGVQPFEGEPYQDQEKSQEDW